ncbi:MAG: CBS domain-containing protein [Betaproteobacteria bacterium]|nr:CBS domain-containing protein [Betaproteobacteria bacterium]
MSEAANSLIQATVEHLSQFAPFDQMAREHLLWMARKLTLGYFAKGEVILSPGQTDPLPFLIIKQGIVQGEQGIAQTQEDSAWLELHEGECFPLGALLADRPVTSVYRASSDVFCYALPAGDFLQLTRLSAAFHDFCTRRIANLLEQSKHLIQAGYSKASSEQQSMSSSLASVIRREPVTCAPDTSIRQALQRMEDHGVGAMVAVESLVPKGILTLHDVLSRVALAGMDLDEPVIRIMSTNLITLPPHAAAHEAALAMAKQGIRHVLVTDSGRLTGVISEKDLFSLQRVGLSRISTAIRHAPDLALLKQCARDIQQLARNMLAQGVAAEQLTQIITTLNDLLTTRIIELELRESPARGIEFCWLALGSEGRFEQTLNTDQDNGIIFALKDNQDPAALRAVLLPFAKRINLALAECGFPLCGGDVMASNPKWCLSLDEWQTTFDKWIYHGGPMDLLHSTIFFDFRPLYGATHLGTALREWLQAAAPQNSRFLHQLAVNALRNRPPLGMVRDFVTGDDHTIDLKMNGITPFVDAARIFSLATGGTHTNTLQRLREIALPLNISTRDVDAYCQAFLFIQLLRLRLHHVQSEQGTTLTNRVDPDTLNNLDQRILKEAFRQARKLQTKLGLDYQV